MERGLLLNARSGGGQNKGVPWDDQVLLGRSQGLGLQDIVGKTSGILRVIEGVKELGGEFQTFSLANRKYFLDLQIEVIDRT